MFEKASRLQLRFNSDVGSVTVEDLWLLKLDQVDKIAVALHHELKDSKAISFLKKNDRKDELNELRYNIVRHIIEVRLKEQEERLQAKERAEKKQRLLEIIAHKEDEKLSDMSIDELKAMVGEL